MRNYNYCTAKERRKIEKAIHHIIEEVNPKGSWYNIAPQYLTHYRTVGDVMYFNSNEYSPAEENTLKYILNGVCNKIVQGMQGVPISCDILPVRAVYRLRVYLPKVTDDPALLYYEEEPATSLDTAEVEEMKSRIFHLVRRQETNLRLFDEDANSFTYFMEKEEYGIDHYSSAPYTVAQEVGRIILDNYADVVDVFIDEEEGIEYLEIRFK